MRMRFPCAGVIWIVAMLLLAGCGGDPDAAGQVAQAPASVEQAASATTPSPIATLAPTLTATPSPSASPTPSPTWTPTATPTTTATPTVTPTPMHPLDIAYMRQQAYPGSDLVFEQTLEPGSNYDRYIVSYRSEGLKIYALFTVPQGERPASGWPVVIFNHGYIPPDQYRSTERYVAYVDAFARRGYIVLRSDYRGHGDSEGGATGGSGSPDYTIDVLNGLASVKRFPDADPARIGMWGHSMGGGVTLRAMVLTPDIKAGVIWAGVVASYPDLLARASRTPAPMTSSTPSVGRRWSRDLVERYGSPAENPAFWAAISANTYVADLSGPVQLHHGTEDKSVPLEYSLKLEQQIAAAGKEVELYTYPGDDHNIAQNWGTAMSRSVAFMDEHVKGAASQ